MKNRILSKTGRLVIIFLCVVFLLISLIVFSSYELSLIKNKQASNLNPEVYDRLYHIIVTGTYENSLFMSQVFEGASKAAEKYNAIVELNVPSSQAEDSSIQELIDYTTFVNADGVIAYIDSSDQKIEIPENSSEREIPLVTVGQFSLDINQVSFIGINYWELGKKLSDEISFYLKDGGNVYLISNTEFLNLNSTNFIPSLKNAFTDKNVSNISVKTVSSLDFNSNYNTDKSVFICFTPEDTIHTTQLLSENYEQKNYILICIGSNETCQSYFNKGLINELITIDPVKIGEVAFKEIFEYRNTGYANTYIAADMIIQRNNK